MKLRKESGKEPVSFEQRLEAIQHVFKSACDKAVLLSKEMDVEIANKQAKIQEIEGEIKEISKVKEHTSGFVDSLNSLIGSSYTQGTD